MSKITFRNRTNGPQEIRNANGENILVPAMGEIGPFDEADFRPDTLTMVRQFQVVEVIAGSPAAKPAAASPVAATQPDLAALMPGAAPQAAPDLAALMPGAVPQAPKKAGRPKKSDAATAPKKPGRPKKA